MTFNAPVAQLDRASVFGTEGQNPQATESTKTYETPDPCACPSLCQNRAQNAPVDADLAAVVGAWADLPQAIKAGIVAMVKAAGAGERG